MLESIRDLIRKLKLKALLIEHFIPAEDYNRLEGNSKWDEDLEDWVINTANQDKAKSANKRPVPAVGLKKPMSEYTRIASSLETWIRGSDKKTFWHWTWTCLKGQLMTGRGWFRSSVWGFQKLCTAAWIITSSLWVWEVIKWPMTLIQGFSKTLGERLRTKTEIKGKWDQGALNLKLEY